MKIIWSPLAVEQARDIACYIALDKPSAAESWIESLFKCVEQLEEFPESGRMVPEIERKDIRELVQGNYRIIYKLAQDAIYILLVKSYRQLLKDSDIEL